MTDSDIGTMTRAVAETEVKAPEQTPLWRRVLNFWPAALVFVFFIALWELIADTLFANQAYLLPSPIAVAQGIGDNFEIILRSAWDTLSRGLIGYALSIVFGIGFAMLLAQSKAMERSFYPWAVIIQTTPIIAVAPIIIIWFGFGSVSIVIIAMLISYFPILNNTHLGLISTDRNQIELFQLHKASAFTKIWNLRLPSAIPDIIAGLRISAGLAITGTILGEFVIGTAGTFGGLGVRVIESQATLHTTDLYGYVICTAVLGLAFFAFVTTLGNRLLRDWHESARREIVE